VSLYRSSGSSAVVTADEAAQLRAKRRAKLLLAVGLPLFASWPWTGDLVAFIGFVCAGTGALMYALIAQHRRAVCPECQQGFATLESTDLRCPHCLAYARIEGKQVTALTEAEIAESPRFEILLPAEFKDDGRETFPAICAGCGVASTRWLPLQIGSPKQRIPMRWLLIPHCDRCEHGASGRAEAVSVQSYRAYRAFQRAMERHKQAGQQASPRLGP
jgi:hypothetical protein